MSVTDGLGNAVATGFGDGQQQLLKLYGELTLAANLILTEGYRQILKIDPGGSARDILLPPEKDGLWFLLINNSDQASGEDFTVKEDSDTTTIGTVTNDQAGLFWCDGTSWYKAAIFTVVAP